MKVKRIGKARQTNLAVSFFLIILSFTFPACSNCVNSKEPVTPTTKAGPIPINNISDNIIICTPIKGEGKIAVETARKISLLRGRGEVSRERSVLVENLVESKSDSLRKEKFYTESTHTSGESFEAGEGDILEERILKVDGIDNYCITFKNEGE